MYKCWSLSNEGRLLLMIMIVLKKIKADLHTSPSRIESRHISVQVHIFTFISELVAAMEKYLWEQFVKNGG